MRERERERERERDRVTEKKKPIILIALKFTAKLLPKEVDHYKLMSNIFDKICK